MNEPQIRAEQDWPEGVALRDALSRGDTMLARSGPILSHLLSDADRSLFTDEIVARIRGMLTDLAKRLLRVQADATGSRARDEFVAQQLGGLTQALVASPALVSHCHALAIEWLAIARLEETASLDPVLSPMLQDLIGHDDPAIASTAMATIAAQTRFTRAQRRLELPLAELTGDLFHDLLLSWREYNHAELSSALERAEVRLREGYDEAGGRTALLSRMVSALGKDAQDALFLDRAGIPLFVTALSARTGQSRDLAAFALNEGQSARLALGLRAAGMKVPDVERQLLRIHPDSIPPAELDQIGTREAAQMIGQSGKWIGV